MLVKLDFGKGGFVVIKKELTLKEIQEISYDILLYYKKICEKNNL